MPQLYTWIALLVFSNVAALASPSEPVIRITIQAAATNSKPLRLGKVEVYNKDGQPIAADQLNASITSSKQGEAIAPQPRSAHACLDEDRNQDCVNWSDGPSNVTITCPVGLNASRVQVYTAAVDECRGPECLSDYLLLYANEADTSAQGLWPLESIRTENGEYKTDLPPGASAPPPPPPPPRAPPVPLIQISIQPNSTGSAPLILRRVELYDNQGGIIPAASLTALLYNRNGTQPKPAYGSPNDAQGCLSTNDSRSDCINWPDHQSKLTISCPVSLRPAKIKVYSSGMGKCDNGTADCLTSYVLRYTNDSEKDQGYGPWPFVANGTNGVYIFDFPGFLPPPPPPPSRKKPIWPIIVGVVVAVVVLLAAAVIFVIRYRSNKPKDEPLTKSGSTYAAETGPTGGDGFYLPGRSPVEIKDGLRHIRAQVRELLLMPGNVESSDLLLPPFVPISPSLKQDMYLARLSLQHCIFLWLQENVWTQQAITQWQLKIQASTQHASNGVGHMAVVIHGQRKEDAFWHDLNQLKTGAADIQADVSKAADDFLYGLRLHPRSKQTAEGLIQDALSLRLRLGSITATGGEITVPGVQYGQAHLPAVGDLDEVHSTYKLSDLTSPATARDSGYPVHREVLYCYEPGCVISQGGAPSIKPSIVVALVP